MLSDSNKNVIKKVMDSKYFPINVDETLVFLGS